jgi:hypothetical protein
MPSAVLAEMAALGAIRGGSPCDPPSAGYLVEAFPTWGDASRIKANLAPLSVQQTVNNNTLDRRHHQSVLHMHAEGAGELDRHFVITSHLWLSGCFGESLFRQAFGVRKYYSCMRSAWNITRSGEIDCYRHLGGYGESVEKVRIPTLADTFAAWMKRDGTSRNSLSAHLSTFVQTFKRERVARTRWTGCPTAACSCDHRH